MPSCLPDYYWKLIFFTCLTLFFMITQSLLFNIKLAEKANYTNKFLESFPTLPETILFHPLRRQFFFFLLILLQSHGSIPRTPSRVLTGKCKHAVILKRDHSKLEQKHVIFISGSPFIPVILSHLKLQNCQHVPIKHYLSICLQPETLHFSSLLRLILL